MASCGLLGSSFRNIGVIGKPFEVKSLKEGAWKLSEYAAFHRHLCFVTSPELKALLKIAPKAHPPLQAYLIDLC